MDEYISREATVKAFCEKCHSYYYYNGHCIHRGKCNVDVIQAVPAADVQPVKHGRWIDNGVVYTCSECNSSVPKNIFVIGCDFEGCPYCFARMDMGDKRVQYKRLPQDS